MGKYVFVPRWAVVWFEEETGNNCELFDNYEEAYQYYVCIPSHESPSLFKYEEV